MLKFWRGVYIFKHFAIFFCLLMYHELSDLRSWGEAWYPLNRFKPSSIFMLLAVQGGTSEVVLYVACFGVSYCTASPSVWLDDIYYFSSNFASSWSLLTFYFLMV